MSERFGVTSAYSEIEYPMSSQFYADLTKHMGFTFCSHGQPFELFVSADASFNCYIDSNSHTGVTLHLGQCYGAVMSFVGKQLINYYYCS